MRFLKKSKLEMATDAEVLAMTDTDSPVAPGSLDLLHRFNYCRPLFAFTNTSTITIGPGAYFLYGKGWCYWVSNITFNLGSGGSNSNSDDLTASEWHYIAIDRSSVSSAGILTASNFINRKASNVTPAHNGNRGGWYQDTDDRTIFGVLTNGSSQVLEFWHDGGEYVGWATAIVELSGGSSTSFTDINLSSSVPKFSTRVMLTLYGYHSGGYEISHYLRKNGSSGSIFHQTTYSKSGGVVVIHTDTSQRIEYKVGTGQGSYRTMGWFLPCGM